jgi:hypothetical protein
MGSCVLPNSETLLFQLLPSDQGSQTEGVSREESTRKPLSLAITCWWTISRAWHDVTIFIFEDYNRTSYDLIIGTPTTKSPTHMPLPATWWSGFYDLRLPGPGKHV